jgi:hypothetical protein
MAVPVGVEQMRIHEAHAQQFRRSRIVDERTVGKLVEELGDTAVQRYDTSSR